MYELYSLSTTHNPSSITLGYSIRILCPLFGGDVSVLTTCGDYEVSSAGMSIRGGRDCHPYDRAFSNSLELTLRSTNRY